jgi:hypothetical protein
MPKRNAAAADATVLRQGNLPPAAASARRNATALSVLRDEPMPSRGSRQSARRDARALLEDDAPGGAVVGGGSQMPDDGAGAKDDEWADVRAALKPIVAKIASGALQGDAAVDALVNAISDMAEPADQDDDSYEDDRPTDRDTGNMDAVESLALVTLRREKRARELLEAVGAPASSPNISRVAALPTREGRRELARKLAANHRG